MVKVLKFWDYQVKDIQVSAETLSKTVCKAEYKGIWTNKLGDGYAQSLNQLKFDHFFVMLHTQIKKTWRE